MSSNISKNTSFYEVIERSAKMHPSFYQRLYSGRLVTHLETDIDYTIEIIEEILENISLEKSKKLWNTLLEYGEYGESKFLSGRNLSHGCAVFESYCDIAMYSPNGSTPVKKCESSLVYFLRNNIWLPNSAGQLFRPADVPVSELHSDFVISRSNMLISALKIGENCFR